MSAKILVVDDEPQLERLIKQRFRKRIKSQDYEFLFSQEGPQALDILRNDKDIDIVLSDINMPKMDGLTFISKLNDLDTLLRTVMVSAYGDMKNIRTAMNKGAYDFVTKPIDFEDLEMTIDKALKDLELLKIAEMAQEKLSTIQQELTIASEVQQSIIPKNFHILPSNSKFEINARMIPASDVGGDFYDFFMLDDKNLGLVIGDVSGKGMPAALFMAVSRTLLKALAFKSPSPHQCLKDVNYLLSQDNPKSMFVTLFYGILNLESGELKYSNGGHNSPAIIMEDTTLKPLDACRGCALGVDETIEYESESTILEPGSTLVMYTDGIPEAINRDNQVFSNDRLNEFIRISAGKQPDQMISNLIKEVDLFAEGMPQSDDITAMIIKHHQGM